jgi:adenosylcobinamide kinase/adenosylcobinamide-phosphate guanylyltransferase
VAAALTEAGQRTALPLALHLRRKLAVVVGGGRPAEAAARRLLSAGARVLVVAPEPGPSLTALAASGLVSVRARRYQAADLDAAWLVLTCATESINAIVAADAHERRIWSASGMTGANDLPGPGSAALLPEPADPPAVATSPDPAAEPERSERAAREGGPGGGRRVLVLGGARSGKSAAAESMLAGAAAVDYVATGQLAGSGDAEWDERLRQHQARRPAGWRTLETCAVAEVLGAQDPATPVLVDCLATWLAQVMDDCGVWPGEPCAAAKLAERADALVTAWKQTCRHVVAVSNEVGCGVVPPTESGRRFRDELGWLNSRIARASDEVWFCTAGIPRRLR